MNKKLCKWYLYVVIGMMLMSLFYIATSFFKSRPDQKSHFQARYEINSVRDIDSPGPACEANRPQKDTRKKATAEYPNLKLEGTVLAGRSSAYIRNLITKRARYYSVGDKISNATLIGIKRGEALLDVEGMVYSLRLEEAYPHDTIKTVSPFSKIVKLTALLDEIKNNTTGLKDLVDVKPQKDEDGKFTGYMVKNVEWGSLPYLAGLRNGDIVQEVNSQRLVTQQKAIQVFKKVRRLKNIEIGLLRNDKRINLNYQIR